MSPLVTTIIQNGEYADHHEDRNIIMNNVDDGIYDYMLLIIMRRRRRRRRRTTTTTSMTMMTIRLIIIILY